MSVFIPTSGGGGAYPYLEYGWVCAPNAAGQSISANTITTLTIDTEIQDLGGHGSISSNQITLAEGTYYFKISAPVKNQGANTTNGVISLYNVTDSSYLGRDNDGWNAVGQGVSSIRAEGQFTIASQKILEVRAWIAFNAGTTTIENGAHSLTPSLSTAGADQRTTIKLWKLA